MHGTWVCEYTDCWIPSTSNVCENIFTYFHNIFEQEWFKSNYIDKKPEKFDNPVEFGFGGFQPHYEIPGCKNVAIIKCSRCKKSLCLNHFFNDYHFCFTYNP